MEAKLCCVVFLGTIVFGICNGAPLNPNEEEARTFAKLASESLCSLHSRITDDIRIWSFNIEDSETESNAVEHIFIRSNAISAIVRNASLLAQTKFKDEELNYAFYKLKKSASVMILGGEQLFSLIKTMSQLGDLAANMKIPQYKNDSVNLEYFPDVQKVFATSNDPEEMKYYWNVWREKNDKLAIITNLIDMVSAIKNAASLTGLTAYDFWMKDFNMTQMDTVMEQITPIYQQLHAFIRHQLNKKYGDAIVNTKGLIPDHLFQQVLAQAWTNGSVIDEMFPHNALPQFDEILVKNKYDTLKLFKTADKFYESMGLETIPESYWGNRIKVKYFKDKGDCRATVIAKTSNVLMEYCHKMDFRTFLQAHGYMSKVHMALEKSHLPAYYTNAYELESAVGDAVILSASSPKYLNKVGLITSPEFSEKVFMNQLVRQAIHSMLSIPVNYVHTKVMADLFAEKIEMTELNKHYWELMDKYVGVGPPGDRASNAFDFPVNFYVDLNENEPARKFTSEVLGYQFYMKLCSITDQHPKEHLQNCDFSGSKDAGDAIKKMIKLGSSKPVREVLATMLPEDPKLNGESLLEYYFPATNRIIVANQQIKVNVGWTHSDKKIESVNLPAE